MILLFYNLLLWLLFPLLLIHYFRGRIALKKYTRPVSERLGILRLPNRKNNRFTILIHAVSVGETVAAQPFVDELRKKFSEIEIVFSSVTEAGFARSREIICADYHVFFPLDYRSCVQRFLDRVNPQYVFILETEIWPNFINECQQRDIPMNFINGRISDKSYHHYSTFRWLLKPFLLHPTFFMQTEDDARRISELGAQKVEIGGNLKYDQLLFNLTSPSRISVQSLFKDIDTPVIIYGSTHRKETIWILDMIRSMCDQKRSTRHIIAPRHLNFLTEYLDHAKHLDLEVSLRSEFAGENFTVMFLDTYGELANMYEGATICVVGGSFESIGGHSILEPALFSKPILYGPYMQNFREVCRKFEMEGACSKVGDMTELKQKIDVFLANDNLRNHIGGQAGLLVSQLTGATQQIIDRIAPHIRNHLDFQKTENL